jgi:hypothetical protein
VPGRAPPRPEPRFDMGWTRQPPAEFLAMDARCKAARASPGFARPSPSESAEPGPTRSRGGLSRPSGGRQLERGATPSPCGSAPRVRPLALPKRAQSDAGATLPDWPGRLLQAPTGRPPLVRSGPASDRQGHGLLRPGGDLGPSSGARGRPLPVRAPSAPGPLEPSSGREGTWSLEPGPQQQASWSVRNPSPANSEGVAAHVLPLFPIPQPISSARVRRAGVARGAAAMAGKRPGLGRPPLPGRSREPLRPAPTQGCSKKPSGKSGLMAKSTNSQRKVLRRSRSWKSTRSGNAKTFPSGKPDNTAVRVRRLVSGSNTS